MFEVARDWNYAAAVIHAESAFNLRARSRVQIRHALKALSAARAKK
jgi:hypothetical protein